MPSPYKRLFFWSLTASLAGFLFGFDTVVISGAEQRIQELWNLGSGLHGLAMSMALWGTVIGALFGGWPSERFGRRATLLWIGVLYLVSAIGSALAPDVYTFMAARFIGGLGVGISTVAAPLFIAEIAPARYRGRLVGLFQFNIVFGILVAFLSNALLAGLGDNAWRWMLGVEAIPALVFAALCLGLPESPRWLILHGRRDDGIDVFRRVDPQLTEDEITQRANQVAADSGGDSERRRFFSARLRYPIVLAFLVAFFNQLSGINAVLYFAPRIFELTGLGSRAALLQSVGIGITNLVFTFVGLYLVDRMGRRTLLYIGSVGYILSLGLCAWGFFTENYAIVPFCIFAFIASHAVGQGAVIWVFIGEIFPNRDRAAGQALGCGTHWVFAALVTLVFPYAVAVFAPGYIFAFFSLMMVLQLIWVRVMVPETRGVPLEEMQKLWGK
jgi:sugar porter (SP) family MFS transporter